MWFDCVERKRSAKLPWSATTPCTFAAAPSFQACLRVFIYTFCMCVCIYVYVCICADMYHHSSVVESAALKKISNPYGPRFDSGRKHVTSDSHGFEHIDPQSRVLNYCFQ